MDNLTKYQNYKEQMKRLKNALNNQFFLEAIFIEYSMFEDRLEAILRYCNKTITTKNGFVSIEKKINKIKDLVNKNYMDINKYISLDLITEIQNWKNSRNPLIHALMKRENTTIEFENLANEGLTLIKTINNKSILFKKHVLKLTNKYGEDNYGNMDYTC